MARIVLTITKIILKKPNWNISTKIRMNILTTYKIMANAKNLNALILWVFCDTKSPNAAFLYFEIFKYNSSGKINISANSNKVKNIKYLIIVLPF